MRVKQDLTRVLSVGDHALHDGQKFWRYWNSSVANMNIFKKFSSSDGSPICDPRDILRGDLEVLNMRTLTLLAVLGSAVSLHAGTIGLVSNGGGTYSYEIVAANGEAFGKAGGEVTFSGMSGVTGESVSSVIMILNQYTTCGFTSTTACFQADSVVQNGTGGVATQGNLDITSTILTTGLINYSLQTNLGTFTGQVLGPVAATAPVPEPGSLTLLALGGFGIAFIRRYRR
jgi:hypothetical protein